MKTASEKRISEITSERLRIETDNRALRGSHLKLLMAMGELDRQANALNKQARGIFEKIKENQNQYFTLGTELEQLTGGKRVIM